MKVTKEWCAREYIAIETMEAELRERKTRFDKAVTMLTNKLDAATPKNKTRKFEAIHGGARYRFSKVAKATMKVLPAAVEDVFGKAARKLRVWSVGKFDKKALAADWGKIPKEVRKAMKPYITVSGEYDLGKIEAAFLKGDITKAQLVSMTDESVETHTKVTRLKGKSQVGRD